MIGARLLQRMIDASHDGIVVAEREGDDHILIYANPAFEHLTGYSVEEVLYQDCRFLQKDDREQPALAIIRQALRAQQPCRQILRNYRKNGQLFWNELSITPYFDPQDQLMYFIGIQKDVSEAMAAYQKIHDLEATLARCQAAAIHADSSSDTQR